jgi:hypothetical protein
VLHRRLAEPPLPPTNRPAQLPAVIPPGTLTGPMDAYATAPVPSDSADPADIVRRKIPPDLFEKFEIFSYRNAAVILSETRKAEFDEILTALRNFTITTDIIRRAGGNESEVPPASSSLDILGPLLAEQNAPRRSSTICASPVGYPPLS